MTELNRKILIVDDEEDILIFLKYNFEQEGFKVFTAVNGLEAIKKAKINLPDIIVMDVMMPIMDGIEAGREIRSVPELKDAFLIYLSARTEEFTEIAAFNIGASDYVNKPIKFRSLLSRIELYYKKREEKNPHQSVLNIQGLLINGDNFTVSVDDKKISLPRKEFKLLYFLAQKPNKVFSRDELLQKIWGTNEIVLDRTVDVHIRKVREKIGENYIKTIKGVGYMFANE